MTSFDKHRLTEMVLYILAKTRGLDYYHLFKVIYFAHITHLAKYGSGITTDDFCALPDGPVPSGLYNCIKNDPRCDFELKSLLDASTGKGEYDAYYMMDARRCPDMDYLSSSEIEVLDKSIEENVPLSFRELREKSHGEEWRRAFAEDGRKVMDTVGMAADGHATPAMLDYIKEGVAIETALA